VSIALGVNLARELVNTPANHMTPVVMSTVAARVARETGLRYEALDRAACKALKMGISWRSPKNPRPSRN
jgi:leucyl aminopeptidase